MPTLPEQVDCELMREQVSLEAFPVGVEKASLRIRRVNLQENIVTILAAQDAYSLGSPAQGLAETLSLLKDAAVSVWDGRGVFTDDDGAAYSYTAGNFEEKTADLFGEMVRRNNTYKTALQKQEPLRNTRFRSCCSPALRIFSPG